MKRATLISMVLMTILTTFMTAMANNIQSETKYNVSKEEISSYLETFEKVTKIPENYLFHSINKVKADDISAYLLRFEKLENKGLAGEHFSFIISENREILGFTNLDKKYQDKKMLSQSETEKIAKEFLLKVDKSLAYDLKNLWIKQHDEQITINGQETVLTGMKYKCYRASKNDFSWVIVGFDGSVITFERNIKWNNDEHKRITEKWLHDSWLIENEFLEKQELKKLVEDTFANGALNKLNVDEMERGFHPDFAILIAKENNLYRLPLNDWMKIVEEYINSPEKVKSGIRNLEYSIEVMDITGNTAVVKTRFFRDKKLIITDYLSFIKYPDGWKAVAKVSNEHITNPLYLNL